MELMGENNDVLSSIVWYFTKANLGLKNVLNMRAPAEGDNLRLYYGLYIESVLAALYYMKDHQFFSNKKIDELLTPEYHLYFRELRNSIVHRGYDVSKAGNLINDIVFVRTPVDITDKNGKIISPPSDNFLITFLLKIDALIRKFIFDKINELKLLEYKEVDQDLAFDDLCASISNTHHIPEIIKNMFFENSEKIKKSINHKDIHDSVINNFKKVIQFENFFTLDAEDSTYSDIQQSFFNNTNTYP